MPRPTPKVGPPTYISPQEAAARASVSVDRIRTLIKSGELPCSRIGTSRTIDGRLLGLLRIRVEDFEALFRPVPSARQAG